MIFPPLRSWLLIVWTTLFFLVTGFLMSGRSGLFVGLLAALCWNYLMFLHQPQSPQEHFCGRPTAGRDPWRLLETIEARAEKLRIPVPQLFICPQQQPLFLASGAETTKPFLLISQALIESLSLHELEAMMVLGVMTIKQRRKLLQFTLDRFASGWINLGLVIDQLLPFRHLQIASRVTYLLAWGLLRLAYSPSIQAKADTEAYQTIRHSRDLATALWKINGVLDAHPLNLPYQYMHLSLLSPPKSRRSAFQFNLPIELRLRFLVGYFPI